MEYSFKLQKLSLVFIVLYTKDTDIKWVEVFSRSSL